MSVSAQMVQSSDDRQTTNQKTVNQTATDQKAISQQLASAFKKQKAACATTPYPSLEMRLSLLDTLKTAIIDHQQRIIEALSTDYGHRSVDETLLAEVQSSVSGIRYIQKHLSQWIKPQKRQVAFQHQPASNWVFYQPKGVVGVMVPWNYPLYLAIEPLAVALAAGNRVMLKLSESTPEFNQVLMQLFSKNFLDDWVFAVIGELEESRFFSTLPFDHLFFTGSTFAGKAVMQAASQQLTPLTLELGGKSPCIITQHADIEQAAQRILFGKALNAGQTCVAPDYLLIEKNVKQALIDALKRIHKIHYGSDITHNSDYSNVINDVQLKRLQHLYHDAIDQGAEPFELADGHWEKRRIPVTLLFNVADSMAIMQEEIFGPLLPVIEINNLKEAIKYIQQRPSPLALYLFSYNKNEQLVIQNTTQSGGLCINDTLMHLAQEDLPFGGIGQSGMGNYHAKEGFITFSHVKAVHKKGRFNLNHWIMPPYGKKLHKILYHWLIR